MSSLLTPEVLVSLADLLGAVVGLVLTLTLPVLSARLYRWTGIRIEEKHMRALHEAIATWAHSAVTRGIQPASTQAYDDLMAYLRQSVPDALKALGPPAAVLTQLAGRYLAQVTR